MKMLKSLLLLALALVFSINIYAIEITIDDKINEIGNSVGLTYEDVEKEIRQLSHDLNMTFDDVLDLLYKEYILDSNNQDNIEIQNTRAYLPNSVAGNYESLEKLSNKKAVKGDIFYFASQTAYWNHGHSGIYYNNLTLVHAVGKGDVVRVVNHNAVSAPRHTFRLSRVNTSTTKRNAASVWAYEKRGIGYWNSLNNKGCSSTFNCSQLIYCAYLSQGIDLSNGSILFVSPWDLIADNDTYIVQGPYPY